MSDSKSSDWVVCPECGSTEAYFVDRSDKGLKPIFRCVGCGNEDFVI